VIVAHEGRVVMEETLDAGLRVLFGEGTGSAPRSASVRPGAAAAPAATSGTSATALAAAREALVRQAVEHYDRARAAQRTDDWATYGAEMQRLGEILRRLRDQRER
jgi:uncharacterized membrane protein (UPF0182 family)